MKKVCFIPARYQSSRLPGKPLLKIYGISVINRVYLQVKKCKYVDDIIVLTDDTRIKQEVESIGGKAELVLDDCLNGTERIIKFIQKNIDICDLVINVQGDEPYINPIHIDICIGNYFKEKYNIELNVLQTQFHNKEDIKCSTLCHVLKTNELKNRSIGKLVVNKNSDIMYCSRNIIPAGKNSEINPNSTYYGHIGVFVFDKEYLLNEFIKENTEYQMNEDIEWLKIIEQGYRISVIKVDNPERGIDTEEDYKYFIEKYNK
jgi:3-deoxy-manno-octulosonate cytidylyltransferase (CMP-KDO synthetase)